MSKNAIVLIGRILLSAIFILSGVGKLADIGGTAGDFGAQQPGTHGMKGSGRQPTCAVAEALAQAFAHFAGSFVGKRQRQNTRRRRAMLFDQMGDA